MFNKQTGVAIAVLTLSVSPSGAAAQSGEVPTSDREWELLWEHVNSNPFHLAALGRDRALDIVLAALKVREDGVLWAAFGQGFCAVSGAERPVLRDGARRAAFADSRRCFERILAAFPAESSIDVVEAIRGTLAQGLAEALVEVDELAGADSLAARVLERTAGATHFDVGNAQYRMNQVRGRVALRRGRVEDAVAFLHQSARTIGSPQLATFGPGFVLARELLEAGHTRPVREFLQNVASFWIAPAAEAILAEAISAIDRGQVPGGTRWW